MDYEREERLEEIIILQSHTMTIGVCPSKRVNGSSWTLRPQYGSVDVRLLETCRQSMMRCVDMLEKVVGTCSTSVGDVVVCQVKNPYVGDDLPWERAYAVVVKQPNDTYSGHPVAMVVTVYDDRDVLDEPVEEWDSWVSARALTIHNVYRDDHFKRLNDQMERPAVQVGSFLFDHERFKTHSPLRQTDVRHPV